MVMVVEVTCSREGSNGTSWLASCSVSDYKYNKRRMQMRLSVKDCIETQIERRRRGRRRIYIITNGVCGFLSVFAGFT